MNRKSKVKQLIVLRKILRAIGLNETQIEELVATIQSWLYGAEEPAGEPEFPYFPRDDFLSPAECAFFTVLQEAVAGWALVCPKVNLGDLFYAGTGDYGRNQTYRNKIARKHVDFLLCDPQKVQPLIGIELDDRSHRRADRQERDRFVDGVFSAAGLPLVHVVVRPGYQVDKLRAFLEEQVALKPAGSSKATPPPAPTCPNCTTSMVLRTAKRGPNAGNQFWGCPNYPQCRTTLPVESEFHG